MAIAFPETINLGDGGTTTPQQPNLDGVSFSPVKMQRPPHLTDYLPHLKTFPNPLDENQFFHPSNGFYLTNSDVVLRQIVYDFSSSSSASNPSPHLAYQRAGPCKGIFFDPGHVRAAIVTCGGLCPGVNKVIRELVIGLWELYGVREILGVKAGYRGFYSMAEPVALNPKIVHNWPRFLRSSLALPSSSCHVFIIGGDGTMRGAVKIFDEIRRRKLNVAIVGIPKTIDNDVGIIDRSFGFQTEVDMAQQAINAAHVEAESAVNGVGLVKLMGRSTGHIALHATLSSRDVDCCLIPENEFYLEGEGGLFEFLEHRLKQNGHAVLVAEGAGQNMIPRSDAQKEERDESGNPVFLDVGGWLKSELKKWWSRDHPGDLFTVKYIDPTYMIRAVPANATDNLYCTLLAHSAIHGVMAGYTGFVVGPVNGNYVCMPVQEVAEAKNPVNTGDHKWAWVRSVTNHPDFLRS
ncbi:LOW QUALITY PROTEIN: ATP-dependent 6-phosphofructokinase 2 [Actinidia eriantha]|uniref:LOW QUALITY PROTEIN: ATP-dependent 6-phosphofructokinase 2 n=1 Tax=Actinidia eriantha TaxID=165200 RepID=UPI00258AC345|nr:LOW QUALITY PROTEIN: ATP-dependent 6-phosphofructokinase 2 [Actinidia eriantha]